MAEIVPIRVYPEAPATIPFIVEQDDFSIKISLRDDPIFWVRLEMDSAGPQVTDFNLGAQQEEWLFRALLKALDTASAKLLSALHFLDMVRGGLQPNNGPALVETRNRVQRAAEYVGGQRGQGIETIELRERRGKVDVVVNFAPAG
jgi:hypothetical protein